MTEQRPLPIPAAAWAVARCVVTAVVLLARRRLHQPRRHLGLRLTFADGTSARVYRETVVDRPPTADPCVLVVEFRLRAAHGRTAHVLFRATSVVNTVLFVGFPGFVSKLWLTHDAHGTYRGVYEWDGPAAAEAYARALWRVLALVSVRGSIQYRVVAGLRRRDLIAHPGPRGADGPTAADWWRLVGVA